MLLTMTKKSKDDILNVVLPDVTGYTSTQANIGQVTNKGIELLDYRHYYSTN